MATPTLVRHCVWNSSRTDVADTPYTFPVPKSKAGNCWIVHVSNADPSFGAGGANVSSVKDSSNNSFTQIVTHDDTGDTVMYGAYYLANIAANLTNFKVAFDANCQFVKVEFFEWANVATSSPIDGTPATRHTTASAVTSGNITTAINGSLVVQSIIDTQGGVAASGSAATADTNFTIRTNDIIEGLYTQTWVQTTAGVINPTLTAPASSVFITFTYALKSAASGSLRGTNEIAQEFWTNWSVTPNATSYQMPFPTVADCFVFANVGGTVGGTNLLSSVSDTVNGSWTTTTGVSTAGAGSCKFAYALNKTASSTMKVTITHNNTNNDHTSKIIDYDAGGLTQTVISEVTASGNLASGGPLTTVTITGQPNGVLFHMEGNGGMTANAYTSPSNAVFDTPTNPNEDGGPSALVQDNCWGFKLPTASASETFIVAFQGTPNVGEWVSNAFGFYNAAAGGDSTQNPTGVSATFSVGTPTIQAGNTQSVSGYAMSFGLGAPSVTTGANVTVNPTGYQMNFGLGTFSVQADVNMLALGTTIAMALGSPTLNIQSNPVNVTINPTGQTMTFTVGTPTFVLSSNKSVSGLSMGLTLGVPTVTGTTSGPPTSGAGNIGNVPKRPSFYG